MVVALSHSWRIAHACTQLLAVKVHCLAGVLLQTLAWSNESFLFVAAEPREQELVERRATALGYELHEI